MVTSIDKGQKFSSKLWLCAYERAPNWACV